MVLAASGRPSRGRHRSGGGRARLYLAGLGPEAIQAFLGRAMATEGLSVLDLLDQSPPRLGYSLRPGDGAKFIVYAEQSLPPDRTEVIQRDSALRRPRVRPVPGHGRPGRGAAVQHGRPAVRGPPLRGGDRLRRRANCGWSSPRVHDLGGALLARLGWVVLVTGLLIETVAATVLIGLLQARRREAEELAADNARLPTRTTRHVAHVATDPPPAHASPTFAGLDIASAGYSPGITGTRGIVIVIDIGKKTVLVIGEQHVGPGVPAASVATVRHSIRMLAAQGESPDKILHKVNGPRTKLAGHFVTVLYAVLDLRKRTTTVSRQPGTHHLW